ncbi:MAG: glycosyltransferase family 39 protein [Chloroflexota bacterium]|nr:glycosyltransferase family 39 protein [Chloroflexota bacterium]
MRFLRRVVTWAGIGLFVLIALEATAMVGVIAARSVGDLHHPAVAPALLASLLAVAATAALMAGVHRWTAHDARWQSLIVILGLSLVALIRIAIALLIDAPVDRDMVAYDSLAAQVLNDGRLFSDRPMGFPYLLAGSYAVFGRGALAGEALNILAALVGGIALWLLVRSAYRERSANVALFLYALWPAGALMTSVRLTETTYTVSLLLAVLAVTQQARPVRLRDHALVGALLAVSQYFRPTSLFLLPAFLLAAIWPGAVGRRRVLLGGATVALAFLAVLLPVVEYNRRAHGELSVSTSAYGGWSLWVGANQEHGGRWNPADWEALFQLTEGTVWDDSKAAGPLGLQRIRDDPVGFALLGVDKFHTMWGSEAYGVDFAIAARSAALPEYTFLTLISQVFYAVVTVAAALVLIARRRSLDRLALLIVTVTLTVALLHVFVEVRDRYHAYLVPLFIALAADWITRRRAVSAIIGNQMMPPDRPT